MSAKNTSNAVIWRLVDGKAGHENQSLGLVRAIEEILPVSLHDIKIENGIVTTVCWLILGRFPPGNKLPAPDLIIAAGHGTHLSMLAVQRAFGGKTVVLMSPGLPTAWFDLCLIPEHDRVSPGKNIILTRGPLNSLKLSTGAVPGRGLILIGGPSRHYHWNDNDLKKQISFIIHNTENFQWVLTDSRRTPEATRQYLASLYEPGVTYFPSNLTARDWLPDQLLRASRVWVTEDSMSMVFEALTTGAVVGLLQVPVKKPNKISDYLDSLVADGHLLRLLTDPMTILNNNNYQPLQINESKRCAQKIIDRFLKIT